MMLLDVTLLYALPAVPSKPVLIPCYVMFCLTATVSVLVIVYTGAREYLDCLSGTLLGSHIWLHVA